MIWNFAQVRILLAACWRFAILRTSDNGPNRKSGLRPYVGQSFCKSNSSASTQKQPIITRVQNNLEKDLCKCASSSFTQPKLVLQLSGPTGHWEPHSEFQREITANSNYLSPNYLIFCLGVIFWANIQSYSFYKYKFYQFFEAKSLRFIKYY